MRSQAGLPLLRKELTLLIFVTVIFVVGLVFGALLVNALTMDQQRELAENVQLLAKRALADAPGAGGGDFAGRAAFYAKWLLLIWVLGVTVVGMPLVLALDFFKGVLVGFAVATLVNEHAWRGLLFSLASVAPQNLIVVPALLIASVSALSFSLYVIRSRLLNRYGTLSGPLAAHTSTALLMLLIATGAALVETYASPVLLKWAAPLIYGA
ncbi:stage II sporulation protein M [Paenibacillus humicola]|uniref:stage II sporulation protein M n=1 Tax=Paenibacillus humicola TaxID=3110540 RepID=UPI00237C0B40|nr:stage II sporulation protein M [Paenibacillus humicola]